MTATWISVALDIAVAALLGVTILYAVRLNRTLEVMRQGKAELGALIGRFDEAAAHAERSVARLAQTAADSGRSLESSVAEAQALRDELAFMLERGDAVAERLAQASRPRPVAKAETVGGDAGSAMERDLERALKTARKAS
jgi:TPR repeat protein